MTIIFRDFLPTEQKKKIGIKLFVDLWCFVFKNVYIIYIPCSIQRTVIELKIYIYIESKNRR